MTLTCHVCGRTLSVDRGIKKRAHEQVFGSIGAKTGANGGQK